jgi:hypothetical protein
LHVRIKKDQRFRKVPARRGLADDRLDKNRVIAVEADVVQSAVGRGVLVLLADRLSQGLDLDLARLARQAFRPAEAVGVRVQGV